MTHVDWFVQDEQRTALEPHLLVALRYLPPHIQSVNVRYDPDLGGGIASVTVLPEYRTANIRVGDGWFSETDAEKRIGLIHEVMHAHVESLAAVFDALLDATLPDADAPLRKWAREQWRRAEEGVCSDLSRVIVKNTPPRSPDWPFTTSPHGAV